MGSHSVRAPPNPSHAGWYSIYLPRRDGRLSWPIVDLIAPRPGVEPATFRSRVRRRTIAPPTQPEGWVDPVRPSLYLDSRRVTVRGRRRLRHIWPGQLAFYVQLVVDRGRRRTDALPAVPDAVRGVAVRALSAPEIYGWATEVRGVELCSRHAPADCGRSGRL